MDPNYDAIRGELRSRGLEGLANDVHAVSRPGLCASIRRQVTLQRQVRLADCSISITIPVTLIGRMPMIFHCCFSVAAVPLGKVALQRLKRPTHPSVYSPRLRHEISRRSNPPTALRRNCKLCLE